MSTATHRNVDLVVAALTAGGADPSRVARMQVLPDAVTTAAAAAAALGVEVGQIANSLVFDADGDPLLVLTSGAHRVDTAKVAQLVGAQKVRRASPDFVREATGQAIGGVAPVGHPRAAAHARRPGAGVVRRGVGGRRDPARRLPEHVRRAGGGHRRRTGRRGVMDSRRPAAFTGERPALPRGLLAGP